MTNTIDSLGSADSSKAKPPSGSSGQEEMSSCVEPDNKTPLPFIPSSSISKGNTEKKEVVRCQACKKRIGIACRYQCRCGLTYCSIHRYPEAHDCTFDYKTAGRNQLRENNPVIIAQKIQEI